MRELSDVVFVSAVRTPMGRFGGTLKDVKVYDIASFAIREALRRAEVSGDDVDDAVDRVVPSGRQLREPGSHRRPQGRLRHARARCDHQQGVSGRDEGRQHRHHADPGGSGRRGAHRWHGEHVDHPAPDPRLPLAGVPPGSRATRRRLERRGRPGGRGQHGHDRREPGGEVRSDARRPRLLRRPAATRRPPRLRRTAGSTQR